MIFTLYNIRKWLCFILLTLAGLVMSDTDLRFSSLAMKDGLANSSISCIAQDKAGFLWIGSQSGLHRYDGIQFTVYQNEPFDTSSLPHNLIQTMFMDADGEILWLGTYGGLARLDTRHDSFSAWSFDAADTSSLINDIVITIARDGRGRLWIGTMEGLCRLDEESGTFVRYTTSLPENRILTSGVIRSLFLDSRGDFWVGSSGSGLYRLDEATDDFINIPAAQNGAIGLPSAYVMSIAEDSKGQLWFGCWFYGLASFNPDTGIWTNLPLGDNRVYFVNAQDPNYVYAGIWGGGLYEYHLASGSLQNYKRDSGSSTAISHDTLYSMYIDAARNVWVGTNGGGLNRMWRLPAGVTVYEHDPAKPGSRSPGRTSAMLKDSRGRLWVGTHNSGLNLLLPGSSNFIRFRHDPAKNRSLPNDIVTYIYEDSKQNIWVLTNSGISRYLEDGNGFDVIQHDPANPDSLPDNIIYGMVEEPGTGNFWLGSYTNGLLYWDTAANRYLKFAAEPSRPDSLSNNLVNALLYDSKGRLWIGTNDGLNRYEGSGQFVRYASDPDNYRGLPSKIVRNLFLDRRGNLWIATNGGGLVLYLEENDTFRYWTRRDGLPSNVVFAVQDDLYDNLWISTTAGLAILDKQTGLIRPYVSFSDLRYREFSLAATQDSAGLLYFGSSNAFYVIDPRLDTLQKPSAPLRLTSIQYDREASAAMNRSRKAAATSVSAWYTEELFLPWTQNHVGFSFAILDYREPGGNQYAYILEGFDDDWIYSGSRNFANYTNLPGGTYRLRVRAANNDGVWIAQEATVLVRVQSPPWLRWWAFVLYGLFLGLMILAITSLRSRFVLKSRVHELSELKDNLEKANARLLDISSHDDLTGLWNRRHFDTEFNSLVAKAIQTRQPVSLIMLDIDLFKAYNEAQGYNEGDVCLAKIAGLVAGKLDAVDALIARYASEELVVVLYQTSGDQARAIAEQLRLAVENAQISHPKSEVGPWLTVSIGVCSLLPVQMKDAHTLIDAAESALYRAKHSGRNRVELKLGI